MSDANGGLLNAHSSDAISRRNSADRNAEPRRRYTEGSTSREELLSFPNEGANRYLDIPRNLRRSLSEDFQDSIEFLDVTQRTMSQRDGTNSLPAIMTGSSSNHPALLQRMHSNHRAVENDYSEQPAFRQFDRLVAARAAARSARSANEGSSHGRRHRHPPRESSGRRSHNRSSSHNRTNRDEGIRAGTSGRSFVQQTGALKRDVHDPPPPRPPLSKYHMEHRYAGRALRVSSSLPASLTFSTGEGSSVPTRHNVIPCRSSRRGKNERTPAHISSRRGHSLTPPPVCRANKPKYDSGNRLVQTVSSPSVVTQCVDSSAGNCRSPWGVRSSSRVEQPKSSCIPQDEKTKATLSQPTHVAITRQPRGRHRDKTDQDDEIAQEKRGLVVSLNNNFSDSRKSAPPAKHKNAKKTKKKPPFQSAKELEAVLKKEERTPMLSSKDDSSEKPRQAAGEISLLKPGEPCPHCGKCSEESDVKPDSNNSPNERCLCTADSCIETATCFCCVQALFYHCLTHEDEETFADKPCSCHSEKCCLRWSIMGFFSLCLPCLCCYPLARGCQRACSCIKGSCQCKEPFR